MSIKEKEYIRSKDLKKINLDDLYSGSTVAHEDLVYDIKMIINTEAPITYNIFKERLRECFGVAKISGKALEIIMPIIRENDFKETDNLYDKTLWPRDGVFDIDYVRCGIQRQIYDVPFEEIKNVVINFKGQSSSEDELFHAVLDYFGYEVLTKKANEYLAWIYKHIN